MSNGFRRTDTEWCLEDRVRRNTALQTLEWHINVYASVELTNCSTYVTLRHVCALNETDVAGVFINNAAHSQLDDQTWTKGKGTTTKDLVARARGRHFWSTVSAPHESNLECNKESSSQ